MSLQKQLIRTQVINRAMAQRIIVNHMFFQSLCISFSLVFKEHGGDIIHSDNRGTLQSHK
jgi:hypothetical protein